MPKFTGLRAIKQSAVMSIQNIMTNKMRSFLTTLGIIIGVMSVVALMTIISGVTDEIRSQFSSIGAGVLTVSAYGTPLKQGLSENDIADIEELDHVSGVSVSVSLTASASKDGELDDDVTINGRNAYYYVENDDITYGRPLYSADMDGDVNVCVVDSDFAESLFPGVNPIGETVILNGYTYKIVGIEGSSNALTASMMQGSDGGSVSIPYKNAMLMSGTNVISSISVYVDDTDYTDTVVDELEALLDNAFNDADDSYWIMNMESLLDVMDTMMSLMTGLMTAVASISLLVGGIGIMNMMLVSVTERTKEIGLRKALGAEPSRIQMQFLIEAIVLSLAGGVIGLIIGNIVAIIVASAFGIEFRLSVTAIALGFGFSAAVGIIFGWAPARKASQLNPIDALRSE